jgi:hypothetical protein
MRARVKFLNSDDIYVQLSQHFKCTFRVAPSVQANNLWMLYVTRIPPPVLSLSKADIDKNDVEIQKFPNDQALPRIKRPLSRLIAPYNAQPIIIPLTP